MSDIGKILPVDGFRTVFNGNFPNNYIASLIHLYQPLIGLEATCLYQLLIQESVINQSETVQTHHSLMGMLNRPLDVIYRARLKLEGIGLLKTYKLKEEDKDIYTYELYAPYSPQDFFHDMMLRELLYHHVGHSKFTSLKEIYEKSDQANKGDNITAVFNDVFQTITPSAPSTAIHEKPASNNVEIPIDKMDFTYLKQVLLNKMIPVEKVLTEKNRQIMNQMRTVYNLDLYELEKSLLWALSDENRLDIEQFITACSDIFNSKANSVPKLTEKKIQPRQVSKDKEKPISKTEKLTKHLEVISPRELLEDLSAGKNASAQDLKMITDIMTKQGLELPVMNVAIYYCLLKSNMRLSKAYLETIASHWSRLGFTTAAEAMEHASNGNLPEVKTRQQRRTYQNKSSSQEVIPDWFKNRKKQNKLSEKQKKTENNKEQDELLALLKKHSSKNDTQIK